MRLSIGQNKQENQPMSTTTNHFEDAVKEFKDQLAGSYQGEDPERVDDLVEGVVAIVEDVFGPVISSLEETIERRGVEALESCVMSCRRRRP